MAEILIGIVIIAISLAAIINAQSFPKPLTSEVPGSAFFPTVIAVALIVACLALIYKGIREKNSYFSFKSDKKGYVVMAITIALTAIYILLFGKMHFIILTSVYIGILALLFGVKWHKAIPSAVISATVVYLVFNRLLNVLLNG